MTRSRQWMVVALVLIGILVLDHASKWWAIGALKQSHVIHRSPGDLFRIQYAENTGAFLSLGSNLTPNLRAWVMIGLNSLILSGIAVYLVLVRGAGMAVVSALSLILAGGVGNLIDRLFRDGKVVDFMNVGLTWGGFNLRSGIFNVADLAIVVGLFILIGHEFFRGKSIPVAAPPKETGNSR